MSIKLIPLLVAIPLGGAFLIPLLEKIAAKGVGRVIAVLVTAVTLFMAISAVSMAGATHWVGGWKQPVGIAVAVDGLTQLLLVTVNLIAFIACVFSLDYMQRFTRPALYYSLFLLMLTGMNGAVITGDLFNLYVFIEIAAIASYGLVAFGCESEELEASFKYLILGSIGSIFILLAVGICYNLTGQLNMALVADKLAQIGTNPAIFLAAGMFLAGFALKAAMVPFHAWLPDAHPAAPAPISALLSGVLIKAVGVYALVRIVFSVLGPETPYGVAITIMGVLSMVIGVLLAVGQWDFKRLLAYHSISQMGYVLLGTGIAILVLSGRVNVAPLSANTVAGLALFGAFFHLFNHATFKSLLFLCSGAVEFATGTRQLKELGGLKKTMPVTAVCCRVASLSIAGVPPFNGFWSKLIIIVAAVQAGLYALAAVAAAVAFVTLLSFIKVQRYALEGESHTPGASVREVPFGMCVAMIVLAVLCIGAGLATGLWDDCFIGPARDAVISAAQPVAKQLAGGFLP